MIISTYRRNGVLVWKKEETQEEYLARTKPIDQMNNAELKVEMKRRLPCCGKAEAAVGN